MKRFSFPKADRIKKPSEYRRLSHNGTRHYCDCFIIVTRNNQIYRSRLGVTVSKKVGKAVKRNQIKRIIRETFRLNRNLLPGPLDINVIARPSAGKVGPAALQKHLIRCLGRVEAPRREYNEKAGTDTG